MKDLRDVVLIFPLPSLNEHYLTTPGDYLSHLIGHEGPGSILSLLKDKGNQSVPNKASFTYRVLFLD